jgi:hypothetical protein
MGGQRPGDQVTQAVGEANRFCRPLRSARPQRLLLAEGVAALISHQGFRFQRPQQRQPPGIGRGGPLFQQARLLGAVGRHKIIRIRCLRPPRHDHHQ